MFGRDLDQQHHVCIETLDGLLDDFEFMVLNEHIPRCDRKRFGRFVGLPIGKLQCRPRFGKSAEVDRRDQQDRCMKRAGDPRSAPPVQPPQDHVEHADTEHPESEVPVGMVGHLKEAVVAPVAVDIHRCPSGDRCEDREGKPHTQSSSPASAFFFGFGLRSHGATSAALREASRFAALGKPLPSPTL